MERDKIEDLTDTDTCTLPDGRQFRFSIKPDCESFEDIGDHGDVYGRTQWTRDNDYGAVRPADFDGTAEILTRDHGQSLWWLPYDIADIPNGREGKEFQEYRSNVRDIMEYGFSYAVLEELSGVDAYGRPIVTRVASLGGIEPFADADYVKSIVTDLFEEIEAEAEEQ